VRGGKVADKREGKPGWKNLNPKDKEHNRGQSDGKKSQKKQKEGGKYNYFKLTSQIGGRGGIMWGEKTSESTFTWPKGRGSTQPLTRRKIGRGSKSMGGKWEERSVPEKKGRRGSKFSNRKLVVKKKCQENLGKCPFTGGGPRTIREKKYVLNIFLLGPISRFSKGTQMNCLIKGLGDDRRIQQKI